MISKNINQFRKGKIAILIKDTNEFKKGQIFTIDYVDLIDNIIEFEIDKYFHSAPIKSVRLATNKEKQYYRNWRKDGRLDASMNVFGVK